MDRNLLIERVWPVNLVALLAEGVDRNRTSLSLPPVAEVALLAEGVDRNWLWALDNAPTGSVALLAEGVDRNLDDEDLTLVEVGRPPRGGRG